MLNITPRIVQAVILGALLLHDAGAQNAAPADRNAINTVARPGGMLGIAKAGQSLTRNKVRKALAEQSKIQEKK
jgi:hypothetical protein